MKTTYDRYNKLRANGNIKTMPFIKYTPKKSDKIERYFQGTTRMDIISGKYYNDGNYGWLIMLANPHLPSLEFLIEDGTEFIVPYPLDASVQQYIDGMKLYEDVYGF